VQAMGVIGCNVCFFSDQIGTCIGQLVIIDDTSFYFLMFSLSLGVGLLKPCFPLSFPPFFCYFSLCSLM
jgi:hypothetical protein